VKSILSYNVNGIRSAISKGLIDFIKNCNPDIICLQETKAQPGQMQESTFHDMGYYFSAFSAEKKGYSGVAILSKIQPNHIEYGIGINKYDFEGRVIRADFDDFSVISIYFPSGTTGDIRQSFKMEFVTDIRHYLNELRKSKPRLIINGDFNICRLWIDIHNPEKQLNTSGFLPEEREWFDQFINDGYTDCFREKNSDKNQFSWWSYRAGARSNNKGWRIDYNIVTDNFKDKIIDAGIMPDAVHSDHCPVWVKLDI
jgi:exodeoxyribonuclease-3